MARLTSSEDRNDRSTARRHKLADASDDGLAALQEATDAYRRLTEELRSERAANADLERELSLLGEANAQLAADNALLAEHRVALQAQLDKAGARAAAEHERSARLLVSIREMHEALFRGGVTTYVLRAAMQLTDAERGFYVARSGTGLTVRAAIDVPAKAGASPSPFVAALVERVLASGEALKWGEEGPPDASSATPEERFRTGAAAPVSMHNEPAGVIIVLDKDGDFDADDIDGLLSVGRHAGVAIENATLNRAVQEAYLATIAVLADTVVAKDPYIHGHCQQVSRYARRAAELLELDQEATRVTCYAALLHDVGKIGVSDGVLNKPGPLLAEERRLIEAHVRIGHDILNNVPALRDVAACVLSHHEWFDGRGYPDGLSGEAIPISARIVGTVDAYCAMLDKRSYKEAMSREEAVAELRRCASTQFDPKVVEAVVRAVGEVEAREAEGPEAAFASLCGLLPAPARMAS